MRMFQDSVRNGLGNCALGSARIPRADASPVRRRTDSSRGELGLSASRRNILFRDRKERGYLECKSEKVRDRGT
jgi:hypothetical protein